MKTFTRENTDVFITLDDNIYGIHSKRVNILYLLFDASYAIYNYFINNQSFLLPQQSIVIFLSDSLHYSLPYGCKAYASNVHLEGNYTTQDTCAYIVYSH